MRVAITGATGLLGRNLLFEFLSRRNADTEIFLFGRDLKGSKLEERIKTILLEEGGEVLGSAGLSGFKDLRDLGVYCINMDLAKSDLGISDSDSQLLSKNPIDIFHHLSAELDFRDSEKVCAKLNRINVDGTSDLLELCSNLRIGQFCYTSTAYACGMTTGEISPNYINLEQEFRNPYEKSKLKAEINVRKFCNTNRVRCRIFRPSTICGKLMSSPLGATPKFDVFYAWALFFVRTKKYMLGGWDKIFKKPLTLNFRLVYRKGSGLNIVPADFAAKVMYEVCASDDKDEGYHLVNDVETPHELYCKWIFDSLNIKGLLHSDEIPSDCTPIEDAYYSKIVGKIYTPYITMKPMLFSVENLKDIYRTRHLVCPAISAQNFHTLMEYAKSKSFGLRDCACP